VSCLLELYFLYSTFEGTCLNASSFFANQLLSIATSSAKRIVIWGLIAPIARPVGIEPDLDNRVSRSERLALADFE